jgi:lipopolysaccharide/colanic/teichoic acid biosynthesis glycosyltransferase
MYIGSEKGGFLTVGNNDNRITPIGRILRKFKLDELPQLFNVLIGNMSLVGPRPEVRKYVDFYTDNQKKILLLKPGITDWASLKFINENDLLKESQDPELYYKKSILPEKIQLGMRYNNSVSEYFKIIFLTIFKLFKN